jgi:phage terminase large subunit-like protein
VGLSLVEQLGAMPEPQRAAALAALSEEEQEALLRSWLLYARPEQLAPDWLWRWWLLLTGRGFGKTRTGGEWVVDRCELFASYNAPHLVGLMNKTNDDVRSLQLHGESGIGAVCLRRGHALDHVGSALHGAIVIALPDGGHHVSAIEVHTGMDPDKARGRNFHTFWADELAAWKHKVDTLGNTAFTNADFSLRGDCPGDEVPRGIVTTTPKPITVIRDLLKGEHGETATTRGSLLDNAANLPPQFISAIVRRYGGTRLGAQEIHGAVLDDIEGALWSGTLIDRWRVKRLDQVPALATVVVGVDPSGSEGGDECGIVVVGLARERDTQGRAHVYVLADYSVQNRPAVWGPEVVKAYHRHNANAVVAETNFGGLLVVDTIKLRDSSIRVERVTASRGKRVRAEPVSTLYEEGAGQAHHVGYLTELEEQLCTWTPLDPGSPDRMDALVWAVSFLVPELTTPPADYAKGFAARRIP